jgi:hypothetical protein
MGFRWLARSTFGSSKASATICRRGIVFGYRFSQNVNLGKVESVIVGLILTESVINRTK